MVSRPTSHFPLPTFGGGLRGTPIGDVVDIDRLQNAIFGQRPWQKAWINGNSAICLTESIPPSALLRHDYHPFSAIIVFVFLFYGCVWLALAHGSDGKVLAFG